VESNQRKIVEFISCENVQLLVMNQKVPNLKSSFSIRNLKSALCGASIRLTNRQLMTTRVELRPGPFCGAHRLDLSASLRAEKLFSTVFPSIVVDQRLAVMQKLRVLRLEQSTGATDSSRQIAE
jgi:hypothetical protein